MQEENLYVFHKDLMDEETFNRKVRCYPNYKEELWKRVSIAELKSVEDK